MAGAKIVFIWRGKETRKAVGNLLAQRFEKAGEFLEEDIKESLGTLWPPASSPGDVPHKRTGRLQEAITHETQSKGPEVTTRVGVATEEDAHYAGFLEIGTSRMQPRPFLRSGLMRNLTRLKSIIGTGFSALVALKMRSKK